jgi:hypothetical protein
MGLTDKNGLNQSERYWCFLGVLALLPDTQRDLLVEILPRRYKNWFVSKHVG